MINSILGTNQDDILSGLPGMNTINAGNGNDIVTGWFLGDWLYGGNDEDKIYGDRGDSITLITIPNGVFLPPITPPKIVFGNDYLSGDNGNDFLSGDTGISITNISFATSNASAGKTIFSFFQLRGIDQTWGDDQILGGNGDDIVFGDSVKGDINAVSSANGSTAIADGISSIAVAEVKIDDNLFFFGSNIIDGGIGNDILIGNTSFDDNEPGGGVAEASNGGQAKTIFTHDNDRILIKGNLIHGGEGNDKIYGNMDINSHEIVAGEAHATTGGSASAIEIISNSFTQFGSDILYGNAGNDEIYGDVRLYYNSISGGFAEADGNGSTATSLIRLEDTQIIFGSDSLNGDSGNDYLFGDALESILKIEDQGKSIATNGGITEVTAEILNFTLVMGDDVMNGGNGSNTYVGDVAKFSLLDDESTTDIVTVNGVDHLRINDRFNNSITWGNDLLTGGSDSDNYNFTLFQTTTNRLGTQGYDVITNFDVEKDVLTFGNIVDQNGDQKVDKSDLVMSTSLYQLAGNTVLSFAGGGAITFLSTNISSLSNINVKIATSPIVI